MENRRSGVLRRLAVILAWAAGLVGSTLVVLAAAPDLQLVARQMAMLAAFIPYGVLAWAFATVVVLTGRRRATRALALVTGGLLVLQVAWTHPYWPHDSPAIPAEAERLTVMTLNAYYGRASAPDLVAAATRARSDVVVLNEITAEAWADLAAAGWVEELPYHAGEPGGAWESDGIMVFSRLPLTPHDAPPLTDPALVVDVATPAGPVTIVAVHIANPWLGFPDWRADHESLRGFLAARGTDGLLVVGDLNAVREHEPMARLRELGLTDAAEQSGAGWLPTYPAQSLYGPFAGVPYPSLIAIDHVLVGPGLAASQAQAFRVAGTDHRGLVAEVTRR